MNYNPGDKVAILACNKLHMFHENCYAIFLAANEKNGIPSVCPSCRKPIDKNATTKKVLEAKKEVDPFDR